jgi:uncharacterized membrane protein
MTLLAALVFVFGIIHINPAMPAWKAHAVQTFGKAYGPVYGLVSLVVLAAVIWAYRHAEPGFVYAPPAWGRYANFALTLIGFLFVGIFLCRGSWRNLVRYPMAIGIAFWAVGHLLANGDLRSFILFGGLAIAALLHAALKSRAGFALSEERQGHNLLSMLGGVALYALAAQLHHVIAGVGLVNLQ